MEWSIRGRSVDGHLQYCTRTSTVLQYCTTVVRIGLLDSDLSVHMCDTYKCQCVEILSQKRRSKIGSGITGVRLHATALPESVPASPDHQQMPLHSFTCKSWRQSSNCAAVDSQLEDQAPILRKSVAQLMH